MNALSVFRYNETSIEFEVIDGELYANATAMCQALGKRPNDWQSLTGTKRYLEAVTRKNGNANYELVITRFGGSGNQGTWIHEKLILKLAQWLDVDFELWCDERISELIKTGQTQLVKPMSIEELIIAQAQSMIETKRELAETRALVVENTEAIRMLEARTQTRPDYFTIVGYASLNGMNVGLKAASSAGQKASRICKARGITTESVPDPRFGQVNMYPSTVLKEVFAMPIQ